jgi:diketogulonate reductase-like aldo/keto reductase
MQSRRTFLGTLAAVSTAALIAPVRLAAQGNTARKAIPSSKEQLPAIGLGSWITFDVHTETGLARSTEVMREFFSRGGAMIDSSPMYGQSQAVIGQALERINNDQSLFSATKVWVPGADRGQFQVESALELWGVESFDLVHVHNLVDWRTHLPWLRDWQAAGRIRYLGASTSHGRRHTEMGELIRGQSLDFVQFTYNLFDREAEQLLLPLAREHGKGVVINRPFQGGSLFRRVAGQPLPDWAAEVGCASWAQFFLKFIISHPGVTCAIPATTNPAHLLENMVALDGPVPDAEQRAAMAAWFDRVTGR